MFYDIPYEALSRMRIDDIKTHSFVEKESRLLQYVQNRSLVDTDRADMDFSIYEMEVVERRIRIPKLKELFERKQENLRAFQAGKDLWKNRRNSHI